MNWANIRMREVGGSARLSVEALQDSQIVVKRKMRHFQGHPAVQLAVVGQVHGTHPTLSQSFGNPVAAELLREGSCPSRRLVRGTWGRIQCYILLAGRVRLCLPALVRFLYQSPQRFRLTREPSHVLHK